MASHRLSSAALAAVVLLGSSTAVIAQTAPAQGQAKGRINFSSDSYTTGQPASPDKGQYTGATTRSVMSWEGAGRWGLKVQLDQSPARDVQSKDMEAGAFYKVTPRLRVGGALGMAEKPQPAPRVTKDETTPKVKLETSLKF
ncbi:MAG: hypothetical protein EON96_20720 [Caulobacteraceae bacterium]|nr:MAG: hypothetical protein EON96_20720 [Caulobacteraceae bacterium]